MYCVVLLSIVQCGVELLGHTPLFSIEKSLQRYKKNTIYASKSNDFIKKAPEEVLIFFGRTIAPRTIRAQVVDSMLLVLLIIDKSKIFLTNSRRSPL